MVRVIELAPVAYDQKPVLRELLNLYLYELSDLVGADPNEHGRFEYRWLDHYWTEPNRNAFFIRRDGITAGFAMVNAHTASGAAHGIAEFFVLRRHRRSGVGRAAAVSAFARFPGSWEVVTDLENVRAAAFWRETIMASAFPNLASVRLEDRNDLLRGRHGLAVEDAAASLIEHLVREHSEVVERVTERPELGLLECLRRVMILEFLDGEPRRLDRILRNLHEIAVQRHALLGLGGMQNGERSAFRSSVMIGVRECDVLARLAKVPRQYPNAVDQQARVGRLVDRGLDDGRVAA